MLLVRIRTIGVVGSLAMCTLFTTTGSVSLAADDEDFPLVVIVFQPPQEALGGHNFLKKPAVSWASHLFPFGMEFAGLGTAIEASTGLLYLNSEERRLEETPKSVDHSFHFERAIQRGVSSLEDSAEWYSISTQSENFMNDQTVNARGIAMRVFRQSGAQYAIFLNFDYLMTPGLDQVRLRVHLKVYKHKSEYSRPPVFLSRVYDYLSLSRGEPLRPWQPEEKEKLIAEIESYHARKLAQYPHNKKAYDTDRKKALGGLKARNVILPRMAMVEGWPGDTLGAELHNATGAMMDIVREDLRILASRPKLDSESVKFSGIDDVGKRKSYKGQLVSSNVSHEVYRRSNGNTFIIPRERVQCNQFYLSAWAISVGRRQQRVCSGTSLQRQA